MLTLKQGLKLSAIVDKMDIKITNPKGTSEEVGAELMMEIIKKSYKAEKEILDFVAETKGISIEEAEKINLVDFIKEIAQDSGIGNFFKSAAKSKGRG